MTLKDFTNEDLLDFIKNHIRKGEYRNEMLDVTYYTYAIRIPAMVTKREIVSEDGKILRVEKYPEPSEDKLTLEILKFGFRSDRKLNENKIIDTFMKTFNKILERGFAEGYEEPLDENDDTVLIRRTYIERFIPIEYNTKSRPIILPKTTDER